MRKHERYGILSAALIGFVASAAVGQTCCYWTLVGSDIENANAGSVGIGVLPAAGNKLEVRQTAVGANAIFGSATAASGDGTGVHGRTQAANGTGVFGNAGVATGTAAGVYGRSIANNGIGVRAQVTSATGWAIYAVGGRSYFETNVGFGTTSPAYPIHVVAPSDSIFASASGVNSHTIRGDVTAATGAGGLGVVGVNHSADGGAGVYGEADPTNGVAVFAEGNFVATGGKAFRIDHPLDPANKYLNHYCTEGPEPLNVYSGIVVLDGAGRAWVQLPDYFEEINRDPRYQLTAIGAPAPMLHVAQRVQDNGFVIAGGEPGMEVSWRIEGVRNDAFMRAYGAPVEVDKGEHRGRYLRPELFGEPASARIHSLGVQNADEAAAAHMHR